MLFWHTYSYSQSSFIRNNNIRWDKEFVSDKNTALLRFNGAAYSQTNGALPIYHKNIPVKQGFKINVNIKHPVFEKLDILLGEVEKNKVSAFPKIAIEHAYKGNQAYANISFIPLAYVNGTLSKLISFDLEISYTNEPILKNSIRTYKSSSPLSSGSWYKISVSKNGLHELNKAFFDSIGINISSLNPKNIRIYGMYNGMLDENNSVERYDGLQEIAIMVNGESDGVFNTNDRVVFYAQGPDEILSKSSNSLLYHRKNIYSDKNFYFLNVDIGAGKRVSNIQNSSQSANVFSTSFNELQYHESDIKNFLLSGREWYGEAFDIDNSQSFTFSFPNRSETDSIYIKTSLIARSTSGTNAFLTYLNGSQVLNQTIPSTGIEYTSEYAKASEIGDYFLTSGNNITLTLNFNKGSGSANGWLNYLEVMAKRKLIMHGDQMSFRDLKSIGTGNVCEFTLNNGTGNTIWDITDPFNIVSVSYSSVGNDAVFTLETDSLREFISFNGQSYYSPAFVEMVENQNLHDLSDVEMVIVVNDAFLDQAQRLKNIHVSHDGLNVEVVKQAQVFNEFSGGKQDICAIRDFMKMLYDKANNSSGTAPKYLLLFGDGSYDMKNRLSANTNYILTYQSPSSLNPVSSLTSDDFFGLLDDSEGQNIFSNSNMLDIGIGRFPAKTNDEARVLVDKVETYLSAESMGSWRNNVCFVADDEDYNIHINDADYLAGYIQSNYPSYNLDKIFFDAYSQVSVAGGERYPDVQKAINDKMFSGTLILNYTGHGGELGWAHERVLNNTDIAQWTNSDKLPLFVTATCEFSRYDDPERTSSGELTLLAENGGTIALMTTVRLVYSSANQNLATNFYQVAFDSINGEMPRLGDLVMRTKNNSWSGENNRKFTLLGDPALRLSYPQYKVATTSINGDSIHLKTDTFKALSKVTVCGIVTDNNDQKLESFNGVVYPTIFDKSTNITTLKNDAASNTKTFSLQKNIIYKGKASVNNGDFCFSFIVPKDINYSFGNGKISYYSEDGTNDANGYSYDFMIGGTSDEYEEDNVGPEIKVYLNDENFAFGGLTDENPLLLLKLEDKSGINTVGNSIGHDLTAMLDESSQDLINLNQYYESELDDYTKGTVSYPLQNLEEGRHRVDIKAWDVFNNSSEAFTEFIVAKSADLALNNVLNYPNPFTTSTNFQFEHNKAGSTLKIKIQIFTISGKLVKTIDDIRFANGYRINDIYWDGLDEYGDLIGKGVYVYRVFVQDEGSNHAEKYEKLVILR